jgi:uncharacterized protein
MNKVLCGFLFLLASSIAVAEPTLNGTPSELTNYLSTPQNTVSLYGEANLDVQADNGIATIKITTEDGLLQRSLQKNEQLKQRIVEKMIKQGIAADHIVGSKFSSTPEYGFWSKEAKSFKVENALRITVGSEKEFQVVAGVIDSYKEVTYQGIELKREEENKIKYKLIRMALADVEEKKRIYEKGFGVALVPKSFSEAMGLQPSVRVPRREMKMDAAISSFASSAPEIQASFGESKYSIHLNVEYFVNKSRAKK